KKKKRGTFDDDAIRSGGVGFVSPDAAPCLKASMRAGKPVTVAGPVSAMGRLDCKDPSLVAFDALRQLDVSFAEVSDAAAEQAAKELSAMGLVTTPSGAAGFAALKSTPSSALPDLIIVSEGAE
ncbi:MAG: pyridoxal-phosphate dependent enzyme, partial [Rhizobiaceae bacterium]|nr:pyridoxal-phosphate dependent enzyme [Rhizobiaceae bacterium]